MESKLLEDIINPKKGCLVALEGENFSGRTDVLRVLTGLPEWDQGNDAEVKSTSVSSRRIYLGPEIYNSISGLAPTVKGELQLHLGVRGDDTRITSFIELTGIGKFSKRNPFTLSGGEQVCLALACALALEPEMVAFDCVFEQLDSHMKNLVLSAFKGELFADTASILADNQLYEFSSGLRLIKAEEFRGCLTRDERSAFAGINDEIECPKDNVRSGTLEVENLAFSYSKAEPLLKDLSVCLKPEQIHCLVGRNGAGKSTLAKILSGTLPCAKGRIFLNRSEICTWKQPGKIVAYHFQNPDVQLFATTVEDEIMIGSRNPERLKWAAWALQAFGLTDVRKEHPLDLPFVMRKRVALAATIATDAPWMILDEPTLGQDRTSSLRLARIMRRLICSGKGLVVITHSEWLLSILDGTILQIENGTLKQ